LVRRIVSDILKTGQELNSLIKINGGRIDNNPELESLKVMLMRYIDELSDLGCEYKDWNFDIGLVDFPANFDGREVFLCWRSDEDELRFYHEPETGFGGRMPIPEKYFLASKV
jgi:hypothetical protein